MGVVSTLSDSDLISESLSRPDAFGEIFDRHFDAISAYLRRRLPMSRADEAASEVFLIAFRRRQDFELARESARPWLFGIATNLIRSSRRDELRRLRAYAKSPVESEPDHSEETIERADASQARPALAEALVQLRREERDVLLLLSWGELTYPEIADALDLPIGTVRSRLARGREQIQELIADSGQQLGRDDQGVESGG